MGERTKENSGRLGCNGDRAGKDRERNLFERLVGGVAGGQTRGSGADSDLVRRRIVESPLSGQGDRQVWFLGETHEGVAQG